MHNKKNRDRDDNRCNIHSSMNRNRAGNLNTILHNTDCASYRSNHTRNGNKENNKVFQTNPTWNLHKGLHPNASDYSHTSNNRNKKDRNNPIRNKACEISGSVKYNNNHEVDYYRYNNYLPQPYHHHLHNSLPHIPPLCNRLYHRADLQHNNPLLILQDFPRAFLPPSEAYTFHSRSIRHHKRLPVEMACLFSPLFPDSD